MPDGTTAESIAVYFFKPFSEIDDRKLLAAAKRVFSDLFNASGIGYLCQADTISESAFADMSYETAYADPRQFVAPIKGVFAYRDLPSGRRLLYKDRHGLDLMFPPIPTVIVIHFAESADGQGSRFGIEFPRHIVSAASVRVALIPCVGDDEGHGKN